MTVVTNNTIQPSSGQALTIKDEGGTASITVATSGEATFAENIILTANKGLSFQNHSVSSATGASSTTSDNVLDDYEEGTWTPTIFGHTTSGTYTLTSVNAYYRKIGTQVTAWCDFQLSVASGGAGNVRFDGLPFNYRSSMGVNPGGLYLASVNTTSASSIGSAVLSSSGGSATVIFPVLIKDNSSFEEIPITGVTTSSRIGFVYTYLTV